MDLVRQFEQEQITTVERPSLRPGDIVRVETKISEGEKTRLQIFEGTIISTRGTGPGATFTVRRETAGFGLERIFPLYSPLITGIEIVKRQKVRRAKLYYLREAAHRRVKEDLVALKRHQLAEQDKKRLAAESKKREEEKAELEERQARQAEEKAKAEEAAKTETEAAQETQTVEKTGSSS